MKRAIQKILRRMGYRHDSVPAPAPPAESKPLPPDAFEVQRELIQTNEPVIFDVGAYIGSVTKIYRERFPGATIHSFEPFPQSFQELSQSAAGDSRIHCHHLAMADRPGQAFLNANLSTSTNSLLTTDERGAAFWGGGLLDTTSRVEVTTTTVDQFCREAGIDQVDILKLDVQGAEFSVLQGAREMLASSRISLIYTEMIMCPTYEGQHKLHEYPALLDSLGYELLDFYSPVKNQHQLIQADVIFLNSAFQRECRNRS